jgi:hypothetical protein
MEFTDEEIAGLEDGGVSESSEALLRTPEA